jgi:hypothetical protein
MLSEVYNPNPTILKPLSTSARKEQRALSSLWDLDDVERYSDDNDSDDVEEINQDEVFGTSIVIYWT